MPFRTVVSDRAKAILLWGLLVLAAALVYLPALDGGFLFDDEPNIVENAAIHLQHFSLQGMQDSLAGGVKAGPLGRPVSVLSFVLTHVAFGLDPYAFKAINLVIHLLNGILVGCLVAQLLRVIDLGPLTERMQRWLPLWVTAAWILHPIHFIAISMAVQRMTLLATMFTLLALIAHLGAMNVSREGPARWVRLSVAWFVCWPLAVLSKETGLLFPVFVLLISVFPYRNPAAAGEVSRHAPGIAAVAVVVAGGLLYWKIGLAWLDAGYAARDFTMQERLLTQARVLWFHLGQILIPTHASFSVYLDWFPVSRGLWQPPTTAFSIVGWGFTVAMMLLLRKRQPMLVFGIAWFLVGHVLELTIIPLEIAHEHRNYLPALGPLLAFGYLGGRLLGKLGFEPPYVAVIVSAAVLAYPTILTGLRSSQMADPLIGSQVEATRHENSARANYVAATRLMRAGYGGGDDPIGAKSVRFFLEQSERSDKNFKVGYLALIIWACASDRPVEQGWLEELAWRLQETPFGHGQMAMPAYILRPLVGMPQCLPREAALSLFEAGASNPLLNNALRAAFLDAAAEYELLVFNDPLTARNYYLRASSLDGGNIRLKQKVEGLMPKS